ncbi:MAG: hypothetical protein IKA23_05895 [Akkermansia sp.]|nr:hypothetical protein [Akkermansia sp.]MBR2314729.1 hypothetical protein [Akkermansia sp.]
MNARKLILPVIATFCMLSLSSCIFQQIADRFIRDEYPGERPPHVIADLDGKPASTNWVKVNPYDLPPSGHLAGRIEYAEDGLPYALPCEFSNILVSPYEPYYQLDYTNSKVGDKVWDPYTRKPFYVPRFMTIN